MRALALLLCLYPCILFAAGAKVVKLKGSATYNGKAISEGEVLNGKGELQVQDKSLLRFHYEEAGHIITVGPDSSLKVDFTMKAGEEQVTLVKGVGRWLSGKLVKKNAAGIVTNQAVMGVRGTDFLAVANPLLGETEIVCFSGEIGFINAENKADLVSISANQWGGIGGRFGKRIAPVLTLPENVMKHFDGLLPKN